MSENPSMQSVPMRFLSWRGLIGVGSGFALLIFWGLVALRLHSSPDNHIGVSVLWALPLAGMSMAAGGLWLTARRRLAGIVLLGLGLMTGAGVVLLDRFNILVEYETWLERGMPERPF